MTEIFHNEFEKTDLGSYDNYDNQQFDTPDDYNNFREIFGDGSIRHWTFQKYFHKDFIVLANLYCGQGYHFILIYNSKNNKYEFVSSIYSDRVVYRSFDKWNDVLQYFVDCDFNGDKMMEQQEEHFEDLLHLLYNTWDHDEDGWKDIEEILEKIKDKTVKEVIKKLENIRPTSLEVFEELTGVVESTRNNIDKAIKYLKRKV